MFQDRDDFPPSAFGFVNELYIFTLPQTYDFVRKVYTLELESSDVHW